MHYPSLAVIDEDAFMDRVKSLLPDRFSLADRIEQARVVERDRGQVRQVPQQSLFVLAELVLPSIPNEQRAQCLASRRQHRYGKIPNTLGRMYREILGGKLRVLSNAVEDQHAGRCQRARGDSIGERPHERMLIIERLSTQATGSAPSHRFFREREADNADD